MQRNAGQVQVMALIDMGEWIDRYGDSLFDAPSSMELEAPEATLPSIRLERSSRPVARRARAYYLEDSRPVMGHAVHKRSDVVAR
jgi:hypothetical protein